MRLLTFENAAGGARFGVEIEGGVLDVGLADPSLPDDLMAFLALPDADKAKLAAVASLAPSTALVPSGVRRLPPVPRPGKILCVGVNYRAHAGEMNAQAPVAPEVFAKFANTLVGDGADVILPHQSQAFDYEAELALVIGRRARHVPKASALAHVAGYMAFNDLTIRDVQMRTMQWTLGKNFDTHGPCGPNLVTADEVGDPQSLDIRLTVDGEVLQASNTSRMIFDCADLVSLISQIMTLEPGDIIATGTPGGVGAARRPPRWLKPGEVVRVEVDRVGVLTNTVRAEPLTRDAEPRSKTGHHDQAATVAGVGR
jgi:2-keto-4-pentenoate hydratase/2-oxohepta-3-ene-1,7-dioic acid hydratase in catechol pathway